MTLEERITRSRTSRQSDSCRLGISVVWTPATGRRFEDYLLHRMFKLKLHGAAIYHVDYRKEDGVWKICRIGYERYYEYFEFRGLLNQLTLRKTTFLDKLKKR